MDVLGWLGLRKAKEGQTPLSAVHVAVRELLPDDEPVVVRYIVVVAVLLTRIAHADGQPIAADIDHLRTLFQHIDRMPASGIDALCAALTEHVPQLTSSELELCYRELKALCDAGERRQVMRLLASQAHADGKIVASEHSKLMEIAEQLDVPTETMQQIELETLTGEIVIAPPASIPAAKSLPPPDSQEPPDSQPPAYSQPPPAPAEKPVSED